MVFGFLEIVDMVFMSIAAGIIFLDIFKPPSSGDPILDFQQQSSFMNRFLYSVLLTAPAILLHEFGHKFVAMYFGLSATFNAAYLWLGIGIVLRLINSPIIFFVPAYISVGAATAPQLALVALAGPVVNLVIGAIAFVIYRFLDLSEPARKIWQYTMWINLGLFVLNMLPVPGFDGSKVFANIGSLF